MNVNRKMCSFVVFCWATLLFAQAPDTLWTKVYGGNLDEYALSIQETFDGGYVISGKVVSFGAGSGGMCLIKMDTNGDTLWTKSYGGEWGWALQQTADSGYIIAGYTWAAGSGDMYLVKTDKYGDSLWTRIFGGVNQEAGRSVRQTSDGGYIVVGETSSFGAGSYDVYLVKTDANGDTIWTRTYGGTYGDLAWSVEQTLDKGYIIAGTTESFGSGIPTYTNVYLIKTDSLGDTLWTRTYGGMDTDQGHSVKLTNDGGYIIAGDSRSFGVGLNDIYLIRTDEDGDTLWTRTYGGGNIEIGRSVDLAYDNGFVITGETWSFGAGGIDVWVVRTDSLGNTLWTKPCGGTHDDIGFSVLQTLDNGFIVAGQTNSFGINTPNFTNIFIIRLEPEQIGIDEVYTQPHNVSIDPLTLSPNPFSRYTTICMSRALSAEGKVLHIYDVCGRVVKSINLHSPVYNRQSSMVWGGTDNDGRVLPNGVYFIHLKSEVQEISQEVLLMR